MSTRSVRITLRAREARSLGGVGAGRGEFPLTLTFHYITRERRRFVVPFPTLNPYLYSVPLPREARKL